MRRILVAMDASPASVAACRAAAELAVNLRAELSGLFVEDVELLRSAALPHTRELGSRTAQSRAFDVHELEAQLRAEAQRARAALATIADGAHVRWSFRIARGAVASELAREAELADLVSLGSVGHGERIGRRVGSTVRALQRTGRGQLMLLRPGMHVSGAVRVLLGVKSDIGMLLEAAIAVTRDPHPELEVIAWAVAEEARRAVAQVVVDYLDGRAVEVLTELVTASSAVSALRQVDLGRPGILVLDAGEPQLASDEVLSEIVGRSGAPVLLVS